jgi:glycosyltransferase involved in cell wall biosynthesis
MDVSIIIPCFNEEAIIAENLSFLAGFLRDNLKEKKFEIIAVDDGSYDNTFQEIQKTIETNKKNIKGFRLPMNLGKGAAIREGVERASGNSIIFTDADLAYHPRFILDCLETLENTDIAIGSRYIFANSCENYGFIRRNASKIFIKITNAFLKLDFSDIQCGIKGFKKKCAKELFEKLTIFGFAFDMEILAIAKKAGMKISEFAVIMDKSRPSRVRIFRDSFGMLFSIIKVAFRLIKN